MQIGPNIQGFFAGTVQLLCDTDLEGLLVLRSLPEIQMIRHIVDSNPIPKPRVGEPTFFERRKPQESQISQPRDLMVLYDFIRMLDADGYPRAFLDRDGFRYEFSRAALYDGRIVADVRITRLTERET